jgi:hypothetical protein
LNPTALDRAIEKKFLELLYYYNLTFQKKVALSYKSNYVVSILPMRTVIKFFELSIFFIADFISARVTLFNCAARLSK